MLCKQQGILCPAEAKKEILINDYIEFLIFGHAYLNTRPHLTSFKIENEGGVHLTSRWQ